MYFGSQSKERHDPIRAEKAWLQKWEALGHKCLQSGSPEDRRWEGDRRPQGLPHPSDPSPKDSITGVEGGTE